MKLSRIAMFALAAALVMSTAGLAQAQDDAAALYKSKCQMCHGPDGKGTPAGQKLGVKDLHSPEVAKMTDEELFKATKEGKGKMPKYEGKLTDDQIKSLVKYIHTLK